MNSLIYRMDNEENGYRISITPTLETLLGLADIQAGRYDGKEVLKKLTEAFPKISKIESENERFYIKNDGVRIVEFLRRYNSLEII